MFGKNAEFVGESCWLYGFVFLVPFIDLLATIMIRGMIREKKGIDGNIVSDALTICCCPFCALVQESQEAQEGAPAAMAMERQ
jgi:Cys-rich protein (TIGR01571 family)